VAHPNTVDEQHPGATKTADEPGNPAWHAHGREADKPSQVPPRGWKDIALRIKNEVKQDNVGSLAAGLAFYAMLAVFPGLVALVSMYGLIFDPADVEKQVASFSVMLPGSARELLEAQLHQLVANSPSSLGIGAALGIAGALWSASSGVASLIKGINIAYDEPEKRGFFKLRGLALLFTLAVIVLAIVALALIAVLPGLLGSLQGPVQSLVKIGRWPVLALGVLLVLAVLFRYAPDREKPRWRWVTWGSAIATIVWLLASAGFSLYVSNFANYDKTYGTLGSVIVLLLWFYVSSFVVLLGAEINAEIEAQTAKDSTTGPAKHMGQRGATKADYLGKAQTT
jgi:membrane protein